MAERDRYQRMRPEAWRQNRRPGSESIELWLFLDNRQFCRVRCIVTKIAYQTAGNSRGPICGVLRKLCGRVWSLFGCACKLTGKNSVILSGIARFKQARNRDRSMRELRACRPATGRARAGEIRKHQGSRAGGTSGPEPGIGAGT